MRNIRDIDQLAKPHTLRLGSGCEIEHDADPFRQERANVRPERVLQSRVALDECMNVGDLAREKGVQKIVLHKKHSAFSVGQISCEGGFTCRHLPTNEDQLR